MLSLTSRGRPSPGFRSERDAAPGVHGTDREVYVFGEGIRLAGQHVLQHFAGRVARERFAAELDVRAGPWRSERAARRQTRAPRSPRALRRRAGRPRPSPPGRAAGASTPTTAASAMPGCSSRRFSISTGYTFSPPRRIRSRLRGTRGTGKSPRSWPSVAGPEPRAGANRLRVRRVVAAPIPGHHHRASCAQMSPSRPGGTRAAVVVSDPRAARSRARNRRCRDARAASASSASGEQRGGSPSARSRPETPAPRAGASRAPAAAARATKSSRRHRPT